MKTSSIAALIAAGIGLVLATSSAQAITYTATASGTGGDGPESASASITTGLNLLTVSLSSLIANPTAAGQEVSDIEITLGSVPTSASLSSSSGTLINIAPGGAVTPAGGSITHWGTALSGATVTLATAGPGSVGGSPIDLIIGPGPYTNANPSITGRNPQIQDTGTFLLSVLGITSSTTVTSVQFSFGTGPDSFLPGRLTAVPLPAALPLFATGLGALGLLGWRRKRKNAAAA